MPIKVGLAANREVEFVEGIRMPRKRAVNYIHNLLKSAKGQQKISLMHVLCIVLIIVTVVNAFVVVYF